MPSPRLADLGRTVLAATLMLTLAMAAALPAVAGEFPDEWFFTENNGERPADHTAFEGSAAPDLTVTDWVNGEVSAEDMEGKILIVDFWATWCQPCIASIPHINALATQYKNEDVLVVGICASGDPGQMPTILEDSGGEYPSAFTDGDQVGNDWPIAFFPTYAVVDATGTVRAIGLKPDAIEQVVDALLEEQAENTGRARIPRSWLEGDAASRERLGNLQDDAQSPPAIEAGSWINTETDAGLTEADLEGKVVLLSFGATWAAPWLDSIEELNALHAEFAEQGLVVVGVCATLEGFALPNVAEQYEIAFPACVDSDNRTNRAYGPNGYPDYYLLDRAGHLRVADLGHDHLRDAVEALLAEEAPEQEADEEEDDEGESNEDAGEDFEAGDAADSE